ncbi:uncharacterized protein [Procambarus clarkii]|uniref:uncharacterized protein n=1 Tax=Procambarus clarkii TaxID=6728 RepID=UPI003742583C
MANSPAKRDDMGGNTIQNSGTELCVQTHSLNIKSLNHCNQTFTDSGILNNDLCEPLQRIVDPENHIHTRQNRTDYSEAEVTQAVVREPTLSESSCEGEKENENSIVATDKGQLYDDLSNKVKVVFNLEGLKEAGGLLYIGCKGDIDKTNPSKITEWFTAEFLNLHRVYAIKEEEPFLLRVFTRNHESTNRGIRKKGGRKVMLMGQEVFGDVLLACGHCGYWSHEGSNVRRHLKKSVCLKERGYSKEDLAGLDRTERRKFLRRVAAAKCRAKKRARATEDEATPEVNGTDGNQPKVGTNTCTPYSLNLGMSSDAYVECLVEIQETCCGTGVQRTSTRVPVGVSNAPIVNGLSQPKIKRKPPKYKALTLGPAVEQEVVQRVPYDIFTVNDKNERVAWKPPACHKASPGDQTCQIVFKGARMKRRCMDLPVPMVLIYRKLDCKTHHCNFTLFHPSARASFRNDTTAKASVNVKMYGDIVMTQEFYHYFVSLLSIMKMKSSQTARHLTSVWETIISERLGTTAIPEEHRKVITLSKQTVKSIWTSIEDEAGSRGGPRLIKGSKRKKKPPAPSAPIIHPSSVAVMSHQGPIAAASCGDAAVQVSQPGMQHHCMKRLNHVVQKPHHPPPPPPPPLPPKPHMMPPPHPPPPPHNHMQQPTHATVTHTHWLGQAPQYPHNMTPYPMAPPPPPPPTAEYYPMPGHFMAQYTPATMGTSP